jgi:PIN domain nuclease of toxin-antitoxin system/antitoxin (DNA-binding transcriptional repressor) of toxin-antitoxin stability system
MKTISTHDAKTHLSRYLAAVEAGQEFVIARGKRPIARLSPLHRSMRPVRPKVGRLITKPFHVPREALAPLSDAEFVNLLLDTCAFLWLSAEPDRLSRPARQALDDASNTLLLSDVTVWEIVLKHQAGKLPMPEAPRSWLPKQTSFFDLQRQPLDLESVFRSGELPARHRDPFDRLLCAQAITHGFTVLTPDLPFQRLGATTLW